jgi:hypothetical protein
MKGNLFGYHYKFWFGHSLNSQGSMNEDLMTLFNNCQILSMLRLFILIPILLFTNWTKKDKIIEIFIVRGACFMETHKLI